jgi:hypothetical protein
MKNFKLIALSLALLGAGNTHGFLENLNIYSSIFNYLTNNVANNVKNYLTNNVANNVKKACQNISPKIPHNSKANHAKLHVSLLAANLVVPAIVNTTAHLKANGVADAKKVFSAVFKHITDFYQLFKKEVVAEGQTPKTFPQKWAEFAQTHKTSATLIKTQLAALAFSGVCGTYTQRKYGYIAYCLATKRVHRRNPSGSLPKLRKSGNINVGRVVYFPDGFESFNLKKKCWEELRMPRLLYFDKKAQQFVDHPCLV